MNKDRRKRIQTIKDQLLKLQLEIEEIKDEEQNAYDNIPESLQNGEKGEKMSEAIDNLESGYESLNDIVEYLDESVE